jgi:hypothetical protein
MRKRDFLKGAFGVGAGLGLSGLGSAETAPAQEVARIARGRAGSAGPPFPHRKLRTTRLFKSPEGYPNGIVAVPEGFWIAEQRTDEGQGVSNNAYLVDNNGRVLRKLETECKNTSGLAFGGGSLWMGANGYVKGIFQVDPMTGRTINHRQIPLGMAGDGGGCHGVLWHEGKLWITALRLRGILRIDAVSWRPELIIPYSVERSHATAWDDGSIWMVTGSLNGPSVDDDTAGLIRYDASSGEIIETAEFDQSQVDPHGITMRDGAMYGCDASIHPLWPDGRSPSSGYIFRIEFV